MLKRILFALILFVAITALALLLPRSLPGELPESELSRVVAQPCPGCLAGQRLVAAGTLAEKRALYVNLRFAAPPRGARVSMAFAGRSEELVLERGNEGWARSGSGGNVPTPISVLERDSTVVVKFPPYDPASLAVAASTDRGRPVFSTLDPIRPGPPHFNLVDAVLLALLAATAWFGFRRGALAELTSFAVVLVSLALSVVLNRPIGQALSAWTGYPQVSAWLACALVVVICTSVGIALAPGISRAFKPIVAVAGPLAQPAGPLLACMRQLPLLALFLALGVELALLHWAAVSIRSSMLGNMILAASRSVISGT